MPHLGLLVSSSFTEKYMCPFLVLRDIDGSIAVTRKKGP